MSEQNPWITHSSKTVYENPWIRVVENRVSDPSGGPGIYGVVHYKNRAVGVIPVDEEDHTWLVGQYRYATQTYEWEIIEGGAPEGEQLLDCAKRELLEEAGLEAAEYRLILGDLQLSNSVTDERGHVYVARGLTVREPNPEATEKLVLRRIPLREAFEMAANGDIRDLTSVAGLLRLQIERLRPT